MVCINTAATYIRELDVFRAKLGIEREHALFEVAAQNELYWSLDKFLVDHRDHDLLLDDDR